MTLHVAVYHVASGEGVSQAGAAELLRAGNALRFEVSADGDTHKTAAIPGLLLTPTIPPPGETPAAASWEPVFCGSYLAGWDGEKGWAREHFAAAADAAAAVTARAGVRLATGLRPCPRDHWDRGRCAWCRGTGYVPDPADATFTVTLAADGEPLTRPAAAELLRRGTALVVKALAGGETDATAAIPGLLLTPVTPGPYAEHAAAYCQPWLYGSVTYARGRLVGWAASHLKAAFEAAGAVASAAGLRLITELEECSSWHRGTGVCASCSGMGRIARCTVCRERGCQGQHDTCRYCDDGTVACEACEGEGQLVSETRAPCPGCTGDDCPGCDGSRYTHEITEAPCGACGQTGDVTCPECGGSGLPPPRAPADPPAARDPPEPAERERETQMTTSQPDTATRLGWAAQAARSVADVTYAAALATVDRRDVLAADSHSGALALVRRLTGLAEGMQGLDVDSATLGEAMDLVQAAQVVAAAAKALESALKKNRAAAARVLADAVSAAADQADSLRRGLRSRHGGIAEAAGSAPVAMADREFYQPAEAG